MSHMDDGTLHTWLDGELDPGEEGRLREHLAACAECRGRLDAARVTRTRAHEILRYADPAHIEQPDFALVAARRGGAAGGAAVARQDRASRVRPLLLPWAASLVLAVGAGWFAQELLRGGGGGGGERVAAFQAEEARVAEADRAVATEDGDAAVATFRGDPSGAAEAESAPPPPPSALSERGSGAAAPGTPRVSADRAAVGQSDPAPAAAPPSASVAPESVDRMATQGARAASPEGFAAADADAATSAAWQSVERVRAAEVLGQPPVAIPGLTVLGYEVAADGSGAVRVTQILPGGESVELTQRPALQEKEDPGAAKPSADVVIQAQGLEIRLRAPVTADSLRRLGERIR